MVADFLYVQRDRVSAGGTLGLGALCVLLSSALMVHHTLPPPPPVKPLTITLTALTEPKPQPVATPAPKVTPPPPKAAPRPEPKPHPVEKPVVAKPVTPVTTAAPTPAPVAAPTTSATNTTASTSASSQATHAPAQAQPTAPPPLPKGNTDHTYEASVLAMVESHKRYPTGRQAMLDHPQGTVRACVTISRSGEVQDADIAGSSGSMLLDQAARRLVSGLTFPPFPEQSFAGQAKHQFCMNVDYRTPNS